MIEFVAPTGTMLNDPKFPVTIEGNPATGANAVATVVTLAQHEPG